MKKIILILLIAFNYLTAWKHATPQQATPQQATLKILNVDGCTDSNQKCICSNSKENGTCTNQGKHFWKNNWYHGFYCYCGGTIW